MIIYLGTPLLTHSSSLPESQRDEPSRGNGEPLPSSLFGLAPDGVYQATAVTCNAGGLLPHLFTLTSNRHRGDDQGGLFSVALSLASRPVGVTDHPVLWSPDFPLVDHSTSDHLTNSDFKS